MRTLMRLRAKQVETLKLNPGQKSRMVCDGGGLWLLIRRGEGGQIIRSYVFRYASTPPEFKTSKSGKSYRAEKSMGLGSVEDIDLAGEKPVQNKDGTPMLDRDGRPIILLGARTLAAQYRALLAQGIDPMEARDTSKRAAAAKQTNVMTFAQAADEYVKTNQGSWKNADHRAQWERTLRTQINPIIGSMNVADVDTAAVLRVVQPIWSRTPETASRIRGRIETVLDFAKVKCGFMCASETSCRGDHASGRDSHPAVAERLQNNTISEAQGNAEMARIEVDAETAAGQRNRDAAARLAAYEAANPAPRRVIVEQEPLHCDSWSDGFGINTQVHTECH
jgi:hypothetical protein